VKIILAYLVFIVPVIALLVDAFWDFEIILEKRMRLKLKTEFIYYLISSMNIEYE